MSLFYITFHCYCHYYNNYYTLLYCYLIILLLLQHFFYIILYSITSNLFFLEIYSAFCINSSLSLWDTFCFPPSPLLIACRVYAFPHCDLLWCVPVLSLLLDHTIPLKERHLLPLGCFSPFAGSCRVSQTISLSSLPTPVFRLQLYWQLYCAVTRQEAQTSGRKAAQMPEIFLKSLLFHKEPIKWIRRIGDEVQKMLCRTGTQKQFLDPLEKNQI